MAGKTKANGGAFKVSGSTLSRVAAVMVPFYTKIATNRCFALRWSKAVRRGDLNTLLRLFKSVTTFTKRDGFSTNAIGYFVDIGFPDPISTYTNGTTIPPGSTQFTFSTPIHQAIARAVLPFYRALARSTAYAAAVAAAINGNRLATVRCLVRRKVKTAALKSVRIRFSGVELNFKYRSSPFTYRNLLFRELGG
ncbi:hypothetical protein [Paenibacillus sp. GCM10023250]|uniref:hypothetical protein n=1 Tax=Paenibacillus sp. GCM10023250 TaxID=3252648 RepID=UPI0036060F62